MTEWERRLTAIVEEDHLEAQRLVEGDPVAALGRHVGALIEPRVGIAEDDRRHALLHEGPVA